MPPLTIKDVLKATHRSGKSFYILLVAGTKDPKVKALKCKDKSDLKKTKNDVNAFNYVALHRQDLLKSVPVPSSAKRNCFCRGRCSCHEVWFWQLLESCIVIDLHMGCWNKKSCLHRPICYLAACMFAHTTCNNSYSISQLHLLVLYL